MLWLSRLFAIAILTASCFAAEAPFQELGFDEALAAAKRDGKVVMVDFFTTWCGPCKRLDSQTWPNAEVRKWLGEKTVALKIDAEKEVKLAKRYSVSAYPTILFIKPDGTRIGQILGFKPPAGFLEAARRILPEKGGAPVAKVASPGPSDDPMARMNSARELAVSGKRQEALAEYLWCFDHGNDEPSRGYDGVRLSFLLTEIASLGQTYPPARQALEERRNEAEAALLSGKPSANDASEAAALNRELGAPDRTVGIYDLLKQEKRLAEEIKDPLVRGIVGPLVEARRYADLVEDGGDIGKRVEKAIEVLKRKPAPPDTDAEKSLETVLDAADASCRARRIGELGLWYEALLGAGQPAKASAVADQLIAFAPDGSTYAVLIDRAVRAAAPDAALALAERGRKSLPDEEKEKFEPSARRIPTPK